MLYELTDLQTTRLRVLLDDTVEYNERNGFTPENDEDTRLLAYCSKALHPQEGREN